MENSEQMNSHDPYTPRDTRWRTYSKSLIEELKEKLQDRRARTLSVLAAQGDLAALEEIDTESDGLEDTSTNGTNNMLDLGDLYQPGDLDLDSVSDSSSLVESDIVLDYEEPALDPTVFLQFKKREISLNHQFTTGGELTPGVDSGNTKEDLEDKVTYMQTKRHENKNLPLTSTYHESYQQISGKSMISSSQDNFYLNLLCDGSEFEICARKSKSAEEVPGDLKMKNYIAALSKSTGCLVPDDESLTVDFAFSELSLVIHKSPESAFRTDEQGLDPKQTKSSSPQDGLSSLQNHTELNDIISSTVHTCIMNNDTDSANSSNSFISEEEGGGDADLQTTKLTEAPYSNLQCTSNELEAKNYGDPYVSSKSQNDGKASVNELESLDVGADIKEPIMCLPASKHDQAKLSTLLEDLLQLIRNDLNLEQSMGSCRLNALKDCLSCTISPFCNVSSNSGYALAQHGESTSETQTREKRNRKRFEKCKLLACLQAAKRTAHFKNDSFLLGNERDGYETNFEYDTALNEFKSCVDELYADDRSDEAPSEDNLNEEGSSVTKENQAQNLKEDKDIAPFLSSLPPRGPSAKNSPKLKRQNAFSFEDESFESKRKSMLKRNDTFIISKTDKEVVVADWETFEGKTNQVKAEMDSESRTDQSTPHSSPTHFVLTPINDHFNDIETVFESNDATDATKTHSIRHDDNEVSYSSSASSVFSNTENALNAIDKVGKHLDSEETTTVLAPDTETIEQKDKPMSEGKMKLAESDAKEKESNHDSEILKLQNEITPGVVPEEHMNITCDIRKQNSKPCEDEGRLVNESHQPTDDEQKSDENAPSEHSYDTDFESDIEEDIQISASNSHSSTQENDCVGWTPQAQSQPISAWNNKKPSELAISKNDITDKSDENLLSESGVIIMDTGEYESVVYSISEKPCTQAEDLGGYNPCSSAHTNSEAYESDKISSDDELHINLRPDKIVADAVGSSQKVYPSTYDNNRLSDEKCEKDEVKKEDSDYEYLTASIFECHSNGDTHNTRRSLRNHGKLVLSPNGDTKKQTQTITGTGDLETADSSQRNGPLKADGSTEYTKTRENFDTNGKEGLTEVSGDKQIDIDSSYLNQDTRAVGLDVDADSTHDTQAPQLSDVIESTQQLTGSSATSDSSTSGTYVIEQELGDISETGTISLCERPMDGELTQQQILDERKSNDMNMCGVTKEEKAEALQDNKVYSKSPPKEKHICRPEISKDKQVDDANYKNDDGKSVSPTVLKPTSYAQEFLVRQMQSSVKEVKQPSTTNQFVKRTSSPTCRYEPLEPRREKTGLDRLRYWNDLLSASEFHTDFDKHQPETGKKANSISGLFENHDALRDEKVKLSDNKDLLEQQAEKSKKGDEIMSTMNGENTWSAGTVKKDLIDKQLPYSHDLLSKANANVEKQMVSKPPTLVYSNNKYADIHLGPLVSKEESLQTIESLKNKIKYFEGLLHQQQQRACIFNEAANLAFCKTQNTANLPSVVTGPRKLTEEIEAQSQLSTILEEQENEDDDTYSSQELDLRVSNNHEADVQTKINVACCVDCHSQHLSSVAVHGNVTSDKSAQKSMSVLDKSLETLESSLHDVLAALDKNVKLGENLYTTMFRMNERMANWEERAQDDRDLLSQLKVQFQNQQALLNVNYEALECALQRSSHNIIKTVAREVEMLDLRLVPEIQSVVQTAVNDGIADAKKNTDARFLELSNVLTSKFENLKKNIMESIDKRVEDLDVRPTCRGPDPDTMKMRLIQLMSQRDAEKAFHRITRESLRALERDHDRLRHEFVLATTARRDRRTGREGHRLAFLASERDRSDDMDSENYRDYNDTEEFLQDIRRRRRNRYRLVESLDGSAHEDGGRKHDRKLNNRENEELACSQSNSLQSENDASQIRPTKTKIIIDSRSPTLHVDSQSPEKRKRKYLYKERIINSRLNRELNKTDDDTYSNTGFDNMKKTTGTPVWNYKGHNDDDDVSYDGSQFNQSPRRHKPLQAKIREKSEAELSSDGLIVDNDNTMLSDFSSRKSGTQSPGMKPRVNKMETADELLDDDSSSDSDVHP